MPRPLPPIRLAVRLLAACLLSTLSLPGCSRQPTPSVSPAPGPPQASAAAARIAADVRALSDARMQGRLTGSAGYDRAAQYVADRFRALGLQPAGDEETYFQRVPLLASTRVADGARLVVVRRDRDISLRVRDQFLPMPGFARATAAVRAPAVFVGQGVEAPDLGHDDFAGLDLHGRIAVLFGGAPARFDADRRAFHASMREKLRTLAAHGAIGAVFVDTPAQEAAAPWTQSAAAFDRPDMRLRAGDGHALDDEPQLQVVARVSFAAADLVFDGSGHTAAELAQAVEQERQRGFALPVTLDLAARSHIASLDGRNVLGRLPGRDPALASQQLLYSAHLDHLGVAAQGGDHVFHGALDNALGVAIVLEAARTQQAPRRPLLFAALTGEEQGLLGAQWLALHPPGAPTARLVADINLDMPMLLAPSRDAIAIGGAHSDLGTAAQHAGDALGVPLSPDPFPEEAVFVRSDQYAFVRAGVPALMLDGGVVPAASSAGKQADATTMPLLAQRVFLRDCYHRPCDDARQPIQYEDAARLARFATRLGVEVGDAPAPPQWKGGDFFGARFGHSAH
ncbi:MAG: M28 family peptidase [Lysobacter sp.]|nr:M28 family peptidase [Lysobacter sp.]